MKLKKGKGGIEDVQQAVWFNMTENTFCCALSKNKKKERNKLKIELCLEMLKAPTS